jgi:fructoselysine-6-P-deglycase FrlB-like protein
MSEPVDYLTEDTYRPYWLEDGVTEETLAAVAEKKPLLMELGKKLSGYERYYMVGSGGSYSVQLPIEYLADKYTRVPVKAYSGGTFLEQRPEAVDRNAVVVLISSSGTTREAVEAVEWCNERGAVTVGLTQNTDSVINGKAAHGLWWDARGVTLGKLGCLYTLFGSILAEKGYEVGGRMVETVAKLPEMLPKMIPVAKEAARRQGLELKDHDEIFVLGGGINWGLAYQYALSTLMEMCWIHGTAIDYSEFRHGALEIFTEGTAAIFLRGRGGQWELEDRIIEFSRGNGVRCVEYDSQGLDVDELTTPFTLFMELEWLSYYLSLARNRRMGTWRFYDKVEF